MTIRRWKLAVTVAALGGIVAGAAMAQAKKVGELKDLGAWINKMPGVQPSIHATGMITAPTPCFNAFTEYAGDDKSNPPIYQVKVTLRPIPGVAACIQKLTDISFFYMQPNYAGTHKQMTIFSDQDSKTISIEIVQ